MSVSVAFAIESPVGTVGSSRKQTHNYTLLVGNNKNINILIVFSLEIKNSAFQQNNTHSNTLFVGNKKEKSALRGHNAHTPPAKK